MQIDWLLTVMNGVDTSADEYERRFGELFRGQITFDQFIGLVPQLGDGATGWEVVETESADDRSASLVVAPTGGEPRLRVLIEVDPADAGRIASLLFQPDEPPTLDDPPETFDEAVRQLDALGRAGVLVAEVTDGSCDSVDESAADQLFPIGSVFKLYVLGAVADAIDRGSSTWDAELIFTEDLASLPSGITQNEEPGTAITVRELARRMISISDNTATDMLIDAVGREAVEAAMVSMGHGDPDVNRPFLTTRELFTIKLDDELLERFAEADRPARVAILDEIADRPLPELEPGDFTGPPLAVEQVEWFATPTDLCRALVHLAERSGDPGFEPIRDAMTEQPGIPDDRFDEIWFKGGSEPGVLAVAWLVRLGERSFTVTGAVADESESFDETTAILTLAAIRGLIP